MQECPYENFNSLSPNLYKMVKHTQTIRRPLPTICLYVLNCFVGLTLRVKVLNAMALYMFTCFRKQSLENGFNLIKLISSSWEKIFG